MPNASAGPLAVVLFVAGALAPPVAVASPAGDTRAEELYRAGQKAAAAQSWVVACADLRESETREHAPGTVLSLAVCEEKLGQLVQAEEHFSIAARELRRSDPRRGYATKRAAALELRLPRLTVHLLAPIPPDATLERDGERTELVTTATSSSTSDASPALSPSPSLSLSLALDPGAHVFVLRASGHVDARTEVKLAEGVRQDVTLAVGPLVRSAPAAVATVVAQPRPVRSPSPLLPPGSASAFGGGPAPGSSASASASASASSGIRATGVAAVVIGGAGLALGLGAGALTLSKKSTADSNCPAAGCTPTGLDAESSGKTWSAVSTAGVIGGAAILATGITLVVLAPTDSGPSALHGVRLERVGMISSTGGASLGFGGTF